ncbi:hypothetical protein MDMS009_802 [Methylophaga thiooxydans DMS010]|uniref:Uncharacterized protein n=1 Tax=Methylophaga thiooxydans DMS010 TaxID=637616 RepID=C0N447_9GAMM|nr:hypothetical protein MDMS009_802 [Methylophaga thiooxydans DMS010]
MLLLSGFIISKWQNYPVILWVAVAIMVVIWLVEYFFLQNR